MALGHGGHRRRHTASLRLKPRFEPPLERVEDRLLLSSAPPTFWGAPPSGMIRAQIVRPPNRDRAGFTVTPTAGLVTTEAGRTARFTVALTSKPAAAVTVPLATTNPLAGNPSAASLGFTPANWNAPQAVTVTGARDLVGGGDRAHAPGPGPAGRR